MRQKTGRRQTEDWRGGEGEGSPAGRRFQAFCWEMRISECRLACRLDDSCRRNHSPAMEAEPWTIDRVQRMIADGIEESLHLDYKAAGALVKRPEKKSEIVKDVTAFANSDGGVI